MATDTDVVAWGQVSTGRKAKREDGCGQAGIRRTVAHSVQKPLVWLFIVAPLLGACLMAPPIEAQPPEINLPPFIDPDRVLPSASIITVTSSNEIVLEASQLFDPNPEPLLFYAWIAEGGWLSQNARVQLSVDQDDLYKDAYYRFDGVQYAFNPCNANVRDKATETIFLYVSDRSFVEVTNTSVTADEGGFLDVWAWVFQIQPGVCDE